jgi:hypothetical protein
MIEQWKGLKRKHQSPTGWDDRDKSRALDLLGTPFIFRDDDSYVFAPQGAPANYLETMIDQEIADLEKRLNGDVGEYDAWMRNHQAQGDGYSLDKGILAIRRFENGCHRRLEKLLDKLDKRRVSLRANNHGPAPTPSSAESRTAPVKPAVAPSKMKTPKLTPEEEEDNAIVLLALQEMKAAFFASQEHKTERCSILPSASSPTVPASAASQKREQPAAEPAKTVSAKEYPGNRKQRRRAAALARSRG